MLLQPPASFRILTTAITFTFLFGANANSQTIFNSIPTPLPGNVSSVGPEAYGYRELGDGIIFTPGSPRLVSTVSVVMSSWACTSGAWFNPVGNPNACVTVPGSTANQPVTLNIYGVSGASGVGPLLGTVTQTFAIPYRPSTEAAHCFVGSPIFGTGKQWYNPVTNKCHHGVANVITFNLSSLLLTLPDKVIVGITYNTTNYGKNPLGNLPCRATIQGCFYDSLNISVEGNPILGSVIDPDGIYVNWVNPASSCNGTSGSLQLDTSLMPSCWGDLHPQIQVNSIPGDVFQVRYASNLTAGDSVINLTNSGANGASLSGPGFGGAIGNICANVYAFSPDEQLISCCSCLITPNGLASLSVNDDLIYNTLTGIKPNSIVVKLVNTAATPTFTGVNCNNSAGLANTANFPVATGMLAYGTTLHQAQPVGTFAVTETPFIAATLSVSELASITNRCSNILGNGSGFGICRSCRSGGLSAKR